jgi:hypothetical protein
MVIMDCSHKRSSLRCLGEHRTRQEPKRPAEPIAQCNDLFQEPRVLMADFYEFYFRGLRICADDHHLHAQGSGRVTSHDQTKTKSELVNTTERTTEMSIKVGRILQPHRDWESSRG